MCYTNRGSLPQSVRQWWGQLKCLHQGSNSNVGKNGPVGVLDRVLPNDAISASKLANFLLHLFQVGLAWHTIGIYCSAISAFLEPHWLDKASNYPVISKLMCHFYLQLPPSCKWFDPWDVECFYLFWKVGHPFLLLLPLSWLGRLLSFWHLLLQSIVLI